MHDLSAELDNMSIILRWTWEQDWVKADIVFSWKCDDSFENMDNWISTNIYKDEYYEQGNKFRYELEPDICGMLSFKVVPYKYDNGNLIPINITQGNKIDIMAKSQDVFYHFTEKKSVLGGYKYIYINLRCNSAINKDAIYYKKNGFPSIYDFPANIKKGTSIWGPVIVKKKDSITLFIREEYRSIYRLVFFSK